MELQIQGDPMQRQWGFKNGTPFHALSSYLINHATKYEPMKRKY